MKKQYWIEKRAEKRYARKLAVVGIVTQCKQDSSLVGCPFQCRVIDVSGHGMKFRSNVQLLPGTSIKISIAHTPKTMYTMEGEVRWMGLELDGGEATMGVLLLEDNDSDLQEWIRMLRTGFQ